MNEIKVLDKYTIDKIAAGEVVERPASCVKELMENSIDSGANAISVEIRDGGITLIRVTDNGSGIPAAQVRTALLPHSTSKIRNAEDLSFVTTLGFRGEALSSIAAVSELELCTKTAEEMTGTIYKVNGGREVSFSEAGLPNGTTVIVRNLFSNIPARLKFLNSSQTEAGRIAETVEKIALSHPDISIKFTNNGQVRLNTTGNGSLRDAVYAVFGKSVASNLLEVHESSLLLSIDGFIGKPEVARSTRNHENYFVNGRYVRSKVIAAAVEEAYNGYQMKGRFPFTAFNIRIEPELLDVNVHPSKMEIRFHDNERVYAAISEMLGKVIRGRENIPAFSVGKEEAAPEQEPLRKAPEPFESVRRAESGYTGIKADTVSWLREETNYKAEPAPQTDPLPAPDPEQRSFFDDGKFLSPKARESHRIIGEIFDTYWIVEFSDKMFIIDQHAAHEKVLYERFMEHIRTEQHASQKIAPGIVVTLTSTEEAVLQKFAGKFRQIGFEIDHFGGSDYIITGIPTDFYQLNNENLFLSFIDEIVENPMHFSSEMLLDRIATAACKAAVKGGMVLTGREAEALIDELLSLENPYNCPHGRPTIISMTKYELEKKFKRIV